MNITDELKKVGDGILTEESLQVIESAFNESVKSKVTEKVNLHVEKALLEQDEEYAGKLETLLEKIDTDHTEKMQKVVEAVDRNNAQKLANVVKKYNTIVNEEAGSFKETLVESIDKYLDLYVEELIPSKDVQEAVQNKRAESVLTELRGMLAVSEAVANESIREAVVDGKNQIDESKKVLEAVSEEKKVLEEKLAASQTALLLEQKTADLPETKRNYLMKVLGDKGAEFITENFDYTLQMFDKTEEEKLDEYKQQATEDKTIIDRPAPQAVVTESKSQQQSAGDPLQSTYMNELTKW
jgi:hypothetical protein